jgi:hypothetical protein
VLVHVVLFRLRADLTGAERDVLLDSFQSAIREIPSVLRATVGPRVQHGAGYEETNAGALPYIALLEFNDLPGLRTYLQHSAHAEPARMFFAAIEASTIADYEVSDLRSPT